MSLRIAAPSCGAWREYFYLAFDIDTMYEVATYSDRRRLRNRVSESEREPRGRVPSVAVLRTSSWAKGTLLLHVRSGLMTSSVQCGAEGTASVLECRAAMVRYRRSKRPRFPSYLSARWAREFANDLAEQERAVERCVRPPASQLATRAAVQQALLISRN